MKRKIGCKIACVLLLCLFMMIFSGCSKVSQLNERLIVSGIGVDIEDNAYVVTMHVFDAQKATAGSSDNDTFTVTGRGRSVLDAFHAVSLQTGKEPLYSQNLVLVVGEDTAYKGLDNVIDFFVRYYESKPSVALFVAKGMTAHSLMTTEYDGQLTAAKDIEALSDSGEINAKQLHSDILTFVNRLQDSTSDGYAIALNLSEEKNGKSVVYADGTAVFKDDKLAGYLDLDETQGVLLMLGDAKNGVIVVPVEGLGNAAFSLANTKSHIEAKAEKGLPVFDISIETELSLYEINGNILEKYGLELIDEMEQQANQVIEKKCLQAAKKVIQEYQADIFRFGRRLMQSDVEYYKTKEDAWTDTYVQSVVRVSADAQIKREGQEINPL